MEQTRKRPKKIFDKRSVFFTICVILMFFYLTFVLIKIDNTVNPSKKKVKGDQQVSLDVANKLKSEKMFKQAIAKYEQYLCSSDLLSSSKANINYIIGNLYFETHHYEEALASYYTADLIGVPKTIQNDLSIKIVNCLERLGRGFSAQYALKSRSSLDKKQPKKTEGIIIAQFGDEKISMRDIDEQLEKLDEKTRNQYRDPQQKFMFFQQYLARKLLAKKASKMGYERDTDILNKLDEIKEQLMVDKMIQSQFKEKVQVTPEDVQLFYQARKDNYNEPVSVRISHIQLDSQETAEEIYSKITTGADFSELARLHSTDVSTKNQGGVINTWLYKTQQVPDGIDRTKLVEAAITSDKGAVTPIIKDLYGFHIIKVLDKKEAEARSFEQVAEQVTKDYHMFKYQGVYRETMENVLKVEGVKINSEAFFPKQPNDQKEKAVEIKKLGN